MLRGLAESFVVSPPSGVTIKTRLRPTPAEEQALREVGTFLGSLYRADLVRRLGEGKLAAQAGRPRDGNVNGALPQRRRRGGLARSPGRPRTSTTSRRVPWLPRGPCSPRRAANLRSRSRPRSAVGSVRSPGTAARASGTARPGAWPSSHPAWRLSRPHWLRGARAWSWAADGCGGTGTTWRRHT